MNNLLNITRKHSPISKSFDVVEAEDIVVSFDFPHTDDCFIVGEVEAVVENTYQVRVIRIVEDGVEIKNQRIGKIITCPKNGMSSMLASGRKTNGVQFLEIDPMSL